MQVTSKLAEYVGLIWDEFFLCDPSKKTIFCPCQQCHNEKGGVSVRSKCKMIPMAIKHFCQELFKSVDLKFPMRSEGIISEFLFDRWLLKALCDDGNKSGLITTEFVSGSLSKNLLLVKDAISSLVSSDAEFEISVNLMPDQISGVCQQRRSQAKRFMKSFLRDQ